MGTNIHKTHHGLTRWHGEQILFVKGDHVAKCYLLPTIKVDIKKKMQWEAAKQSIIRQIQPYTHLKLFIMFRVMGPHFVFLYSETSFVWG